MHWASHRLAHAMDDEPLGRVYDHQVVMRLLVLLLPYWRLTLLSTGIMLVYTLTSVLTPWIIQQAIESVVTTQSLDRLRFFCILFCVNAVINYGSNYYHLIILSQVSQHVLYDLRTRLFSHLQRLSLGFFAKHEVGSLMSRTQNDVHQLQEFLSILVLGLGDILALAGIVVAMLLINTDLALITFTVMPILILIMGLWQHYAKQSFLRVRQAIARVNSGLQESISGVRITQSMNREEENFQKFEKVNFRHMNSNLQATRISAALLPTVETLTAISLGLVIVFGGSMVMQDEIGVGTLVAFVLYIHRFFEPVRNLTIQYTQLQRAMTAGQHIFELLEVQPEIRDAPDARRIPPLSNAIMFREVWFQYSPEIPVLRNINLTIQSGETVALVGPTGAGKTTLVSLLARFYDPTYGNITMDGVDLKQATLRSLAIQRSMVLQEPFLNSGSVMENIRYCHIGVSDREVIDAAKAVGIHEAICRLEQGYETRLQERGGNLSQGQRQLLSLARALVGNPRLIILDEATANIDSYTEMLLQRALQRILNGRTALVIAHRLSTVRHAHRIVVLDKGSIVEEGPHETLIATGGLYSKLYGLNFQDFALPNQ